MTELTELELMIELMVCALGAALVTKCSCSCSRHLCFNHRLGSLFYTVILISRAKQSQVLRSTVPTVVGHGKGGGEVRSLLI